MKLVCSVFLLEALTAAVTGLITRKHTFVNIPLNWVSAQAYCRSHFEDLSTIDSPEELNRFNNQTGTEHYQQLCWIGLSKKPEDETFNLWSDGSPVNNYINWYPGQPDGPTDQNCGLILYNRICDHFCQQTIGFFCYTWEPKLFVVQEEKTWVEALKHCRTFYADLMSFNSKTDLDFFNNGTKGIQTHGFWTGLRFHDGSWYWVNRDGLGSLFSPPSCPVQPFVCGSLTPQDNVLENRDCGEKKPFICYVY